MNDLSPIGKRLLNLLPKNSQSSILKRYILTIDSNLDVDSLLREIAKRMGILIPVQEDANIYLPLYLELLFKNSDILFIEELLVISEKDFYNKYKNTNTNKNINYNNRLNLAFK